MKATFIGDFKKLMPMGFSFNKLYARNYKVYEKNQVWIWVAGKSVEVKDLYDDSGYIIKLILNDEYPVYEEDITYPGGGRLFFKKGQPKGCVFDSKTKIVASHKDFIKEHGSYLQTDYQRYRELIIPQRIFDTVKEIANIIRIDE